MSYREYWIDCDPVPQGRPRFCNGRAYEDKKSREFKRFLSAVVGAKKDPPMNGPLHVSISFFIKRPKTVKRKYPTVRPDIDNYAKAVLDACNGILWKDDAQIVELCLYKRYEKRYEQGILMCVQEID